jgi:LCP family protein required for cell wall assembly
MSSDRDEPALDRLHALDPDRNPDRRSAPREHDGSAGGQLAASIILPGIPTIRRIPAVGVLLFLLGVIGPIGVAVWVLSSRGSLIELGLDTRFLAAVVVAGLAIVISRLAAIAEVAHAFRHRRGIGARTALATLITIGLAVPVLLVSFHANNARNAVDTVFAGDEQPMFEPADEVDPNAINNVLLLGGDAGPGRFGMRTDSMILVSVHEATGRTALISIPRNLQRLQFPPGSPLAATFPDGFDDLTNALFTYIAARPELIDFYGGSEREAGAKALSEALGYTLDVEIDDYALVDMEGFVEIVDAIGGVNLDLAQSTPLPPSLPGQHPLPAQIGPGPVEMDGVMAIAFVRTRVKDSDYNRMSRQRQLLSALDSQLSIANAVVGFAEASNELDDSMRTSLSSDQFASLVERFGDNLTIGESVGLVPPLIEPGSPDFARVHAIVDAVQNFVLTGTPSGFSS